MTTAHRPTERVDGRTAYADERFRNTLEEYEFMLGYGISPEAAARRAGTNLEGLRTTAHRRGIRLPETIAEL
ncbi:hypothetical protein L5G28_07635 [Gordonia sp. HY285]|uniref:hypothetical protein n=1 Tax=Gordonia liuliyuniae TaxID=2911517 RepID=UPI001F1F5AC4|nr:hypothetical protein [Gordonia liuliyuniae]MCF8610032.1 hypothetical protein [Gordonia liuliyuniae]